MTSTLARRLAGKVCLITGAGSGIGLATARLVASEGARVALAGRDASKLDRAAQELGNDPDTIICCPMDVTRTGEVQTGVQRVLARWGRIDILVNNAGLNIKKRTFRELTPESWQLLVRANLDGAFHCIHSVLPHMLARADGLIININSVAGKRANPLGGAAYAAAKFGMRALANCLAAEERENGIRVSTIFPGEVDTPILENRPRPVTAEQRALILQPEDVAAAVLFVATLPARATVPELVIKPTSHLFI